MTCSHDDCQEKPRWKPVLVLRPSPRSLSPRKLRFRRLGYCDQHRRSLVVTDLLSEEGFEKIAKIAREAGLEKPHRDSTTLAWEKLTRVDLRRLGRLQHRTASPPNNETEDIED